MMPRLAVGALTLLAALFTSIVAHAAELLMVDDPGCVWCRRWNAEIAPSYPKPREGQQAPLRRVPIRDQARAGVALARPINITPTFVLVEDGQEVGRIDGYAGKDFFYPMLAQLLRRILPPNQRLGPSLQRSASCTGVACGPARARTPWRGNVAARAWGACIGGAQSETTRNRAACPPRAATAPGVGPRTPRAMLEPLRAQVPPQGQARSHNVLDAPIA